MCHFKQNYTARMEDSDQSGTVVAVCQMNSTNEVERNLEICEDLIRKAKTRGAKVINIFFRQYRLLPFGMLLSSSS